MICTLKNTVTGEYLESAVLEDGFLRHTWHKETIGIATETLFIMDEHTAKRYKTYLEDQGIHTTIMATDGLQPVAMYRVVQVYRVFATLALMTITAIMAAR